MKLTDLHGLEITEGTQCECNRCTFTDIDIALTQVQLKAVVLKAYTLIREANVLLKIVFDDDKHEMVTVFRDDSTGNLSFDCVPEFIKEIVTSTDSELIAKYCDYFNPSCFVEQ